MLEGRGGASGLVTRAPGFGFFSSLFILIRYVFNFLGALINLSDGRQE